METEITLGQRIGDMAEVPSGVRAGDRVAMNPLDKVKNGSRIKVAEK